MRYALLVHGSPYSSKACHSALVFAQALQQSTSEHSLSGVFFYQDSVLIGNKLQQTTRDEFDIQAAWLDFSQEYNIPLSLCIAASVSRGVISESESKRYELGSANLADGFQLEGLGTLVSLLKENEKLVNFR